MLIAFSTLDLFSQIEKGKIIISFDGNYNKTINSNGVNADHNTINGKYLSVGTSIGFFLSNRFIIGIGLDYDWNKEYRFYEMTLFYKYYQSENMNITSKVFLPNIYFGYYYQIINKLYFNSNLKFSFSKIKTETNSIYAGFDISSDLGHNYVRIPPTQNSETDFFSININPEMTYFLSNKFSVYIGLGGIEYSISDWKNDNSSWTINFNPIYWSFGIKMKI